MTFRRLVIAAVLLLAAVWWKLTFPPFRSELLPALQDALGEEQVVLFVPEGLPSWLRTG